MNAKLNERKNNRLLVSSIKKEIQMHISDGLSLTWDSYKVDPYVFKMTTLSYVYSEKVRESFTIIISWIFWLLIHVPSNQNEELTMIDSQLQICLDELESCSYESYTISSIIERIQRLVDELSFKKFSNLENWVALLDQEVNFILYPKIFFAIHILKRDVTLKIEKKLLTRLQTAVKIWIESVTNPSNKSPDLNDDYKIEVKVN